MAFKLKPLVSHSVGADFLQVFNKTMRNNKTHETGDPGRVLSLRASQLPFCPFDFFVKHAMNGMKRSMDMRMAYYVSVGTTVHTVMQTYLGQTSRFLADWKCPECGKWHRLCKQPNCCGTPSDYHEISINYKGVKGHIDAVFIDEHGNYWILDFKTSSLAGAPKKLVNPGVSYIEQIETYAFFIKRQHKITVKGVMLCFIPRDNPAKPVIWSRTMKKSHYAIVKARFKQYRRAHRDALDLATKDDIRDLVANYEPCTNPFCEVCPKVHGKAARRLVMLNAFKAGKANGHVPIRKMAEKAQKRQGRRTVADDLNEANNE